MRATLARRRAIAVEDLQVVVRHLDSDFRHGGLSEKTPGPSRPGRGTADTHVGRGGDGMKRLNRAETAAPPGQRQAHDAGTAARGPHGRAGRPGVIGCGCQSHQPVSKGAAHGYRTSASRPAAAAAAAVCCHSHVGTNRAAAASSAAAASRAASSVRPGGTGTGSKAPFAGNARSQHSGKARTVSVIVRPSVSTLTDTLSARPGDDGEDTGMRSAMSGGLAGGSGARAGTQTIGRLLP